MSETVSPTNSEAEEAVSTEKVETNFAPSLPEDEVEQNFSVGKHVNLQGFTSSSLSRERATKFAF